MLVLVVKTFISVIIELDKHSIDWLTLLQNQESVISYLAAVALWFWLQKFLLLHLLITLDWSIIFKSLQYLYLNCDSLFKFSAGKLHIQLQEWFESLSSCVCWSEWNLGRNLQHVYSTFTALTCSLMSCNELPHACLNSDTKSQSGSAVVETSFFPRQNRDQRVCVSERISWGY